MTIDASYVVRYLRGLGRSDPTCRAVAERADHTMAPALEVCHAALTRLAADLGAAHRRDGGRLLRSATAERALIETVWKVCRPIAGRLSS